MHAPNDVIVDASMPAMIRSGGKMWGADGRPKDTKAVIPESTFARIYQEMINFCKTHGAFDPTTSYRALIIRSVCKMILVSSPTRR